MGVFFSVGFLRSKFWLGTRLDKRRTPNLFGDSSFKEKVTNLLGLEREISPRFNWKSGWVNLGIASHPYSIGVLN